MPSQGPAVQKCGFYCKPFGGPPTQPRTQDHLPYTLDPRSLTLDPRASILDPTSPSERNLGCAESLLRRNMLLPRLHPGRMLRVALLGRCRERSQMKGAISRSTNTYNLGNMRAIRTLAGRYARHTHAERVCGLSGNGFCAQSRQNRLSRR